MNPVLYAMIAALAGGVYTVFQREAAGLTNRAFGALMISLFAAVISGIVLLSSPDPRPLYEEPRAFLWLALVGAAAFSVNYFSLQAYSRGLPLSVGGPIFIGGSIAIATLAGFLMGEGGSLTKLLGVGLVLVGALILTVFA